MKPILNRWVFDKIDLLIRHMETGNDLALPVTTTQTSVWAHNMYSK